MWRLGKVVIVLFVLLGALAATLHYVGRANLSKAPVVDSAQIAILTEPAALARGQHLAQAVSGCADCHGQRFAGKVMDDAPPNVYLVAPNLTAGQGGIAAGYSDQDWIRGIAHGIGGDGRVLGVMPSEYYAEMSAYDLGALIGYLKTVPPVDHDLGPTRVGFPGTIIFGVLEFNNLPVNKINHPLVGTASNESQVQYLLSMSGCVSCHGKHLAGLTGSMGPPPGPNLTTLEWTTDEFIHGLRTGQRPDGSTMAVTMPWPTLGKMTEPEMQQIWDYVLGLPHRELGDNE